MTRAQINDALLQIANLEGRIEVYEDTIETIDSNVEYTVLQSISKDKLDAGDLETLNGYRTSYMVTSHLLGECRKKIVSLKKAANIDLDEADKVYDN